MSCWCGTVKAIEIEGELGVNYSLTEQNKKEIVLPGVERQNTSCGCQEGGTLVDVGLSRG